MPADSSSSRISKLTLVLPAPGGPVMTRVGTTPPVTMLFSVLVDAPSAFRCTRVRWACAQPNADGRPVLALAVVGACAWHTLTA
jgi:hypothetical protein